jgi:MSHA biogenesis protein MshP
LRAPRHERGFAAVAALFVLVVLAALGAFMVSISSSQQVNSARDVQGSRAYWAARAGLEWAVGSLSAAPAACPTPPGPFTVEGFTVAITCTRNTYDEAGSTRVIYSLGSRASAGGATGGLGFVERSVSASVEF